MLAGSSAFCAVLVFPHPSLVTISTCHLHNPTAPCLRCDRACSSSPPAIQLMYSACVGLLLTSTVKGEALSCPLMRISEGVVILECRVDTIRAWLSSPRAYRPRSTRRCGVCTHMEYPSGITQTPCDGRNKVDMPRAAHSQSLVRRAEHPHIQGAVCLMVPHDGRLPAQWRSSSYGYPELGCAGEQDLRPPDLQARTTTDAATACGGGGGSMLSKKRRRARTNDLEKKVSPTERMTTAYLLGYRSICSRVETKASSESSASSTRPYSSPSLEVELTGT